MPKHIPIDAEGRRLLELFPTRFFVTAEAAMKSSDGELSGSSTVYLLPCGIFTWVDEGDWWIHPEYGSKHSLTDFYECPVDDDGWPDEEKPSAIEIAYRFTTDNPFGNNFGPWELADNGD